jgi:hypothetical protein
MLNNLDAYPLPSGRITAEDEIPPMTRLIIQEVGHVTVAAVAGIPVDYVIIDEHGERHATYIDETYRSRLERDRVLNARILAGGYAAELAMFGAADLWVSSEDLFTLAGYLGISASGAPKSWMKQTALRALWAYQPVLQPDAVEPIKRTYAMLAAAIKSKTYLRYGAHVIPIEAFHTIALPLPDAEYWRARERTKAGTGRDEILATLRAGVLSGV